MVMYGLYVLHRCGVKTVVLADERYSSVIAREGVSDGDGHAEYDSALTKAWKTEARDARRRNQIRKKERRKRAKQLNCCIEKHAIDAVS